MTNNNELTVSDYGLASRGIRTPAFRAASQQALQQAGNSLSGPARSCASGAAEHFVANQGKVTKTSMQLACAGRVVSEFCTIQRVDKSEYANPAINSLPELLEKGGKEAVKGFLKDLPFESFAVLSENHSDVGPNLENLDFTELLAEHQVELA